MKSHTSLTYLERISQTRRSQCRFLNNITQELEGCMGRGEMEVEIKSLCKISGMV